MDYKGDGREKRIDDALHHEIGAEGDPLSLVPLCFYAHLNNTRLHESLASSSYANSNRILQGANRDDVHQ